MKRLIPAAALLACLALAGCSHTFEGIKKDTKQNEPAVAQALKSAGNSVSVASQKAAKAIEKGSNQAAQAQKKHEENPQSSKS